MINNDQPKNSIKEDELGYSYLSYYFAKIIKEVETKDKAYVLGLCGKWGNGKTTIINYIKEILLYSYEKNIDLKTDNYRNVIEDIKNTTEFLNKHNIQGLKIHSTYIVNNTQLANMYNSGNYTPISLDYYIETASYVLTHINPNIIIHKISGDAPKDLLIAPEWNKHKKWIMNGLDKHLNENNLYQGMYFNNVIK